MRKNKKKRDIEIAIVIYEYKYGKEIYGNNITNRKIVANWQKIWQIC